MASTLHGERNVTVTARPLCGQSDYEAAVVLQEQIWGADTRENVPACLLRVSGEVGGISAGAFTMHGELVGFVFGITGPRNGKLVHWSHLLAVETRWRDRGIGGILKRYQREELLKIGVDSMYWTFDPLESRNAHLNLNKLGAVVDRYVPNYYGEDSVAITDKGIGTDRFVVRWDFKGEICPPASPEFVEPDCPVITIGRTSEVPTLTKSISPSVIRLEVPADIQSLKSTDPDAGAEWRAFTRGAFIHLLDAGYRVTGFTPGTQGSCGWYVLEPPRD